MLNETTRLFGLDDDGKFMFVTVAELAAYIGDSAPPPPPPPPPDPDPDPVEPPDEPPPDEPPDEPPTDQYVDLIIDNITWTPAAPKAGDAVTFHAQVRNIGSATMPGGTVAPHETASVAFYVGNRYATWSDDYLGELAPGAAVTVTANGGPWDQGAVWFAVEGEHTVLAHVNDMNRKNESDTTNNKFEKQITVAPADAEEPPPFPSDGLPTAANTGPRTPTNGTITMQQWIAAGHAENKVITGVHVDQVSTLTGKTLTATDCEFSEFYYIEPSTLPDSQIPTFTLTYCRVQGNFTHQGPSRMTMDHVHCVRQAYVTAGRAWLEGFRDHEANQTPRAFPWKVSNSWFHAMLPPMPPAQAHSEGLHIVGACVGAEFRNVRVSQDGGNNAMPLNNNVTGIIKATGIATLWQDCTFDWNGGPVSSYFSLNMEGRNVRMVRCRAQPGARAFFFNSDTPPEPRVFSPIGGGGANAYTPPECIDCASLDTGAPFTGHS